ncbi:adhesin/invasin [Neisseria meningitidis]|nr:adhesin/invasin [Neisseria meningitidis]
MKHFQSKVLTAAILAALSGSAMADNPPPSTDEIATAALVGSYNNAQEINSFEVGDAIYGIDGDGKITKKTATQEDVDNDDFKGLGLKEVLARHDQSLADLTGTVEENSEALVKTAEVVNDISADVKANTAAIGENKAAIATKADKTELDKVSGKVTENETAIGKKANSADVYTKAEVYTKQESDNRFVKISDGIGNLNTTANGLETRLAAAEQSVADHGTRLASAEKSITEHGTRLNGLDRTVSDLRKETRQGLAEQAALSGLFQPYNVGRFNVTAAVGGYKSESAVAIGTGFRFTENFAAKAGVAVGTSSGSSAAYHVGVNYEW